MVALGAREGSADPTPEAWNLAISRERSWTLQERDKALFPCRMSFSDRVFDPVLRCGGIDRAIAGLHIASKDSFQFCVGVGLWYTWAKRL